MRVPNRDAPIPGVDGILLTCRLAGGIADDELPVTAPRQLRELWRRTAGGLLLVDMRFGVCGLTLFDPVESSERANDRKRSGYDICDSDWVIGEFTGDTDMVIADVRDRIIISLGSYPRDQWLTFDSLEALLERYIDSYAEKFWD